MRDRVTETKREKRRSKVDLIISHLGEKMSYVTKVKRNLNLNFYATMDEKCSQKGNFNICDSLTNKKRPLAE